MCPRKRTLERIFASDGWTTVLVVALLGCGSDMADQPRFEAFEATTLFPDGNSSRPIVEGTVARGYLQIDRQQQAGRQNGQLATEFPMKLTRELLERGQQRYQIFCTPCHDSLGNGQGMVVRRGFPPPPSLHIERLRIAPVGHFYQVVSFGLDKMPSYGDSISYEDRWAIVAYVRALQRSQNVKLKQLTPEEQIELPERD